MDRDAVWQFLDRFTGFAAGFTTISLLAVAERAGLLTALAAGEPMTVAEVVGDSGADERLTDEILSALVAAAVLDHADGRFTLPPEHAAVVADDTSPYSMTGWLDMLPAVAERLPAITSAVTEGGGVPFSAYDEKLVAGIDRANSPALRILLTRRWLTSMPDVVATLEAGGRVADIGCGSGTAAVTMAEAFPASQIVGIDVDEHSIQRARRRSEAIENVSFVVGDAAELDGDPGFDLVTAFDVVHDLPYPLETLVAVREALRPDGVFLMMEPSMAADLDDNVHPRGALVYGISALFCLPQSLAAGGAGLGAAWGPEPAQELCHRAGFGSFRRLPIDNPFSAFYRVER